MSVVLAARYQGQRARAPSRREVTPSIKTSSQGVRLDAELPSPLSRALNHQAAQSRRAAPGENNCWPKPVDWPLPSHCRPPCHWILAASCSPPAAADRHQRHEERPLHGPPPAILFLEDAEGSSAIFFFTTHRNRTTSPDRLGRHPHVHMHRPRVTALPS